MNTVEIILLSLFIAFMAMETYWWGGTIYIARPVCAGPIIGLIMGDLQTGLICGGMIEMVFLGGLAMGAYSPPNSFIGGMVGTALAIISGGNIELGVALAYPIGLLVQWLNYLVSNLNLIWVEKAESAIKKSKVKQFEFWHYMSIFSRLIIQFFLPTVIALLVGSTVIQNFYDSLPVFIINGLKVATDILPAIGMASILAVLGVKKGWPYFLVGFLLASYMKLDIMAIALLGLAIAAIQYRANTEQADAQEAPQQDEKPAGVLNNKDLRRIFFRSFTSSGSFNFKNYNSIGYLYSIIPGLQKIYKENPEGYQEALTRNTEFFNTHPYFANLIMGVSLALEEENSKNPEFDVTAISSTKAALMGPLAGIGDSVFQGTYRVLFSAIGAGFAMDGNPIGPIIYIIPQMALAWGSRWGFLKAAYRSGINLVVKLRSSNLFQSFIEGATVVGLMVIAAMTASFVSLKLKPEWVYVAETANTAAKSVSLQGVLDAIFPNLLPVLIVIAMYKIMEKVKGGVYWCLGGTFVIAFVGVLIGLF